MPTIQDVAKRAGVSTTTVSRVINQSGAVSDETRHLVQAAIDELGYVPNRLAISLRSSRTYLIAHLGGDFANSFSVQVVHGIEEACAKQGFHMILSDTEDNEAKEGHVLKSLLERQVDGIIIRPVNNRPEPVKLIQSQGTPVVVLDLAMPGIGVDVVRGDSEGGAYQLTRLLLDLGHRRIAALSGPRQESTATMRVEGYCRALTEYGVEPQKNLIFHDTFSFEGGRRMARQALALVPRPTALFAANNKISLGILRTLREGGLRIPQDISVVGFDELPFESMEHPFLTVNEQSPYEMGKQSAELLLARLSGRGPEGFQEVVLPGRVVYRESCAPHAGG